jgi:TolA-binding protein
LPGERSATVEHEARPEPVASGPSEARLMADALGRLRADGDAAGALALLEECQRRFPNGALATEARVATAEALLSLGRRSEALRVLDRLGVERWPHGAELAVTRGELRVAAGRHKEAIQDFSACADGGSACRGDLAERALFGRAGSRAKLGDETGAREDLSTYVRAFPHGRFAAAARAALGSR